MIKNIIRNIGKSITLPVDIEYIWGLTDENELNRLKKFIEENNDHKKISLESNIYYPQIFKIEDNCPTCGYRTPFSKQKYAEEFIVKSVEHKLKDLDTFPIDGINCINKDFTGLRELFIVLNFLGSYDLEINVSVSSFDSIKYLKNFHINSVIYNPRDFSNNYFNKSFIEENAGYDEKVIKYIKENMGLKVTYVLNLNYNESHVDIFNMIMKLKKLNVDYVEIMGFDPFIDSPEEYNPQYSRMYILKIISLLRLYLPDVELKIQYATNDCNFMEDYLLMGVNHVTGIYTNYMYGKLENIEEMMRLLKR